MKNKKILMVVIVVLIVALVVLGTIIGIKIKNNESAEVAKDNTEKVTEQNKPESSIIVDDNKNEEPKKEEQKVETKVEVKNLVEDAINDVNENAGTSVNGEKLKSSIRLPKINIDTPNVAQVNKEIEQIRQDMLSSITNHGGYDITVDYTYTTVPSKDLLFICIKEIFVAKAASGGSKYCNYIYDMKNDKFLNVEETLNLYNVSKTNLIPFITDRAIKEDSNRESYAKERVENAINDNKFIIYYLGSREVGIYIEVDPAGVRYTAYQY